MLACLSAPLLLLTAPISDALALTISWTLRSVTSAEYSLLRFSRLDVRYHGNIEYVTPTAAGLGGKRYPIAATYTIAATTPETDGQRTVGTVALLRTQNMLTLLATLTVNAQVAASCAALVSAGTCSSATAKLWSR